MKNTLLAAFALVLAAAAHAQSQDAKPTPAPGKKISQEAVCDAYGRLPDVQPPFAPSKTGRQPVALKTFNVTAAYLRDSEKAGERTRVNPLLVSGNKAISVNGLNPFGYLADSTEFLILVNGRSLLAGHFVGVLKGGGYAYPFPAKEGTKPTASFDAANGSVTASKEYQLVPAGAATYSHTLKALEDGKTRLSWDLGLSPEAFSALRGNFAPEFYLDASCRELGVSVDGLKAFICHDDLTMTSGPIFHPDWYRRHVFPYYPAIFAPFKEKAIPLIFTSAGNCSCFVDEIFASGADGLNFEYLVSLRDLVERHGDKILIGNLSSEVIASGPVDRIEAEVRQCIETGKHAPRFVMNVGGGLTHDMSVEHLEAYLKIRSKLCREARRTA